MKLLVLLVICATYLDLSKAKSDTANQDSNLKVSSKLNSVSTTPKPDYQTIQHPQLQQQYQQSFQHQYQYQQQPLQPQLQRPLHAQAQQQIVIPQHQLQQIQYQPQVQVQPHQLAHLVQKAFYVPQQQNHPATMIIIAQPAYVPGGAVHGGAAQQLVNYFQNNPQARYQFLHGNYQPQQSQAVQAPIQQPAHTVGNYVVAVPARYQQNIVAVPVQRAQAAHLPEAAQASAAEQAHQISPLQLAEIAQLANQQYSRINPSPQPETTHPSQPQQYPYQNEARAHSIAQQQVALPVKSLPPIFTGFENFSPEQQEKIKAQLSAHFGVPLQPLPAGKASQVQAQVQAHANQYSKYQPLQSGLNTNEFIPSEQAAEDAGVSSQSVSSNKSQYAKA